MMNYVSVLSVSKVCPPCDNELKADNIMEHYCASDFGKYQKWKKEQNLHVNTTGIPSPPVGGDIKCSTSAAQASTCEASLEVIEPPCVESAAC